MRDNWTAIAGGGVPCPIEFFSKEIKEHEEQLKRFRCYEAAVKFIRTHLDIDKDGLVYFDEYDAVRKQLRNLEKSGSWDEEMTRCPFPFKDGEYSFFLS